MASRLELNEDTRFQRKQLRVARGAVVAFIAVLALALLGVFGSGAVSHTTAGGTSAGLAVDYQRFLRFGEGTEVDVQLRKREGTTTLAIGRDYLDGFVVDGIVPAPDAQSASERGLTLTFEDRPPDVVRMTLIPRRVGVRRARVSVDAGRPVSFRQLVYP